MKTMFNQIRGSRKLWVYLLLFAVSTAFVWYKDVSFSDWSDFQIWLFGVYVGGNFGEHMAKNINNNKNNNDAG